MVFVVDEDDNIANEFVCKQLDWAAFAVMTLPSLGIPFLLWHRSKCKYENMKLGKKSS